VSVIIVAIRPSRSIRTVFSEWMMPICGSGNAVIAEARGEIERRLGVSHHEAPTRRIGPEGPAVARQYRGPVVRRIERHLDEVDVLTARQRLELRELRADQRTHARILATRVDERQHDVRSAQAREAERTVTLIDERHVGDAIADLERRHAPQRREVGHERLRARARNMRKRPGIGRRIHVGVDLRARLQLGGTSPGGRSGTASSSPAWNRRDRVARSLLRSLG
jgi:hypothetical protein